MGARIPERAVEMGVCSQLWQGEVMGSLEEDGEQGDFPEQSPSLIWTFVPGEELVESNFLQGKWALKAGTQQ